MPAVAGTGPRRTALFAPDAAVNGFRTEHEAVEHFTRWYDWRAGHAPALAARRMQHNALNTCHDRHTS